MRCTLTGFVPDNSGLVARQLNMDMTSLGLVAAPCMAVNKLLACL